MCHFGGHIVLFLFFLAINPTCTYGAPTSLYQNNFVPISVISFFGQCSNKNSPKIFRVLEEVCLGLAPPAWTKPR